MRLKICGMKYKDNIAEIAKLQPDYLGFIFYENSPRSFGGTIPKLPKSIKKVGVFVNAPLEDILDKIKHYDLNLIQLHGEESPEFCRTLNSKLQEHYKDFNNIKLIKVFSIHPQFDFEKLQPYESVCDFFLFDTKGQLPGGNGYTFNWKILTNYPSTKLYFLSGGIGLDEVLNLMEFFKQPQSNYCYAIDVNSKFEIKPGLKDLQKLKEFLNLNYEL